MASSLPAGAGPGAGSGRSWRPVAIVAAALGAVLLLAVLADGRLLVADADPSVVTDADVRLARSLFADSVPPEALAEACIDDTGTIDPTCLGDGRPGGTGEDLTAEVVPRDCRDDVSVSAACIERELGIDVPEACTSERGSIDIGCMAERGDLLVLTDECLASGRLPARCLTGRVFGVPDPGPESGERPSEVDLPGAGPTGREPAPDGLHDGASGSPDEPASDTPEPDRGGGALDALTQGLGVLVLLALVVGLLVVLALALRRWQGRPGVVAPGADDEEAHDRAVMAESLDASVQQLDLSQDPRTAIIAAYAMLLEGLAACAQGRRPSETPLEHLERVLAALDVRPDPLRELTALFGEARFSDHALDDQHVDRARTALAEAAADLDRVREAVG